MKILQITADLPSGHGAGGAERFCFDLAGQLSRLGISVEIAAPGEEEAFQDIPINQLHKTRNKFARKFLFDYWNIANEIELKRILVRFQPDVVHFHNFYGISSRLAYIASKNVPVVITAHDYWPFCYWSTMKSGNMPCPFCLGDSRNISVSFIPHQAHSLIHRMYFRNCHFVAPSKYMAEKLKTIGKFSQVSIIPNGISIPDKVSTHGKTILWVGRISKEKGLASVAQDLDSVGSKYPGWRVIVLGEGPLKAELAAKYKHITFKGFQNPDRYYRSASILVMSSVWPENMPYTLIEAMGYGLTVIAPAIGGIPELVQDGASGYLYKTTSEFNKLLEHVIADTGMKIPIGKAAREKIKKNYSFEYITEKYIRIYSHLSNHRNSGNTVLLHELQKLLVLFP